MLRLAADEDFNNRIIRGLYRREPTLDIARVQDVGLRKAADPVILEWAAQQRRILLTHDERTMPDYVYARVEAGLPMPGVFLVTEATSIGDAIEALLLVIGASQPDEWENQVLYLEQFLPL